MQGWYFSAAGGMGPGREAGPMGRRAEDANAVGLGGCARAVGVGPGPPELATWGCGGQGHRDRMLGGRHGRMPREEGRREGSPRG